MSYYAVTYSNSLSHHGIKGQKWGIRRFQNEDGTLTEAGKKRYAVLTRKNGSIDYAERTPRAASKKFKNTNKIWNEANEYALRKTEELNKTKVGKKFGKYVDSGVLSSGESGKARAMGKDLTETLDALDVYVKYRDEMRKIMTDSFDNNIDYLLTDNGYEATEEGREYVRTFLHDSPTYKLAGMVDPISSYNIYKRRAGN